MNSVSFATVVINLYPAELKTAAKDDPLITAALNTIPLSVAQHGVYTLPELREQFESVAKAARKDIPDTDNIGKSLITKVIGFGSDRGNEAKLAGDVYSRASTKTECYFTNISVAYYLDRGNLELAVQELQTGQKKPHERVTEWMSLAKERIIVEHAIDATRLETQAVIKEVTK
jgi:hypothetical protein